MVIALSELHKHTVNLGPVGFRPEHAEPFEFLLDATPLAQLLNSLGFGLRVPELLRLQQPGDVLPYVLFTPKALPKRMAYFVDTENSKHQRCTLDRWARKYAIPDPDEAAEVAWYRYSISTEFRDYLQGLFKRVQLVQQACRVNPQHLAADVISRCETHEHPWCFVDSETLRLNRLTLPQRMVFDHHLSNGQPSRQPMRTFCPKLHCPTPTETQSEQPIAVT